MRLWLWGALSLTIVGIGIGLYFLTPTRGPERDLTLVGDVAHGQYLLRLGGCVACHTDSANGRAALSGGAPLTTAFGSFVPPNITSHPEAGIGRWTLAQFSAAISDGEGPNGHLYPSFPYENYTLMSDQEVVDLYAALQATDPVAEPAPPSDIAFPFNQRWLMAGWKRLFFTPARYQADPAHDALYNRGRYLAFGPGHCAACHSPRNDLGAVNYAEALTGSPGGPGGRAPSLKPAALVAEGYDVETLMQTLKDGWTPNFDVLGGTMTEVIEGSTAYWNDDDLRAISTYLLTE